MCARGTRIIHLASIVIKLNAKHPGLLQRFGHVGKMIIFWSTYKTRSDIRSKVGNNRNSIVI